MPRWRRLVRLAGCARVDGAGIGRGLDIAVAGRGVACLRLGIAVGVRAGWIIRRIWGWNLRRLAWRLLGGLAEQQTLELCQADAGLQQRVLQPHQGAQQRRDARLVGGVEWALRDQRDQSPDLARLVRRGPGVRQRRLRGVMVISGVRRSFGGVAYPVD